MNESNVNLDATTYLPGCQNKQQKLSNWQQRAASRAVVIPGAHEQSAV